LVAAGELLDGFAACELLDCSSSTLRRLVAVDEATVRRLVAAVELLDGLAACRLLGCAPSTLRKLGATGEVTGQVIGPRGRRWCTRAGL
jgi:hypothetical protein